jgi:hypothetical protein
MKNRLSLCIAALLAVTPVPTAVAWQPGALVPICEQGTGGLREGPRGGQTLSATIRGIDYRTGLLDLETEGGKFRLDAAPEEVADLKVGDVLLVWTVGEDGPLNILLQDSVHTSLGGFAELVAQRTGARVGLDDFWGRVSFGRHQGRSQGG